MDISLCCIPIVVAFWHVLLKIRPDMSHFPACC